MKFRILDCFDEDSNSLTTTNACGTNSSFKPFASEMNTKEITWLFWSFFTFFGCLLQFMHQMTSNSWTTGSQWMTKSNCSTIHIQFAHIQTKRFCTSQCLHTECFVNLWNTKSIDLLKQACLGNLNWEIWILTSTKSISFNVNPETLRTFWMAGTGPIPIISGGTPTAE